ncbi:MAG TPA: cupin domain-containing protein [Candidatus Avacidaminococcus intestinavium]|uniref:Cupin domain-containing protein n=1 Tax=Candidatus Avacidaminococcus intestinavium TaxID=2840684 RepID=A0A9D1SKQ0_9FIRM|nr:cupin domain-containing protein [Candidatus Avacidaminococcus intestinavium]
MSNVKYLKNITPEEVLDLKGLITYQEGQVVSRTLAQNPAVSLTLFAFGENEEISTHASTGDAMVVVLEGSVQIMIGDNEHILHEGQTIVMPAGIPHSLRALSLFKMMLTVVFPSK